MPRDDLPLCACGWFERAANDPACPLEFDPDLNEYNLVANRGSWRLYHCPFCAGRAPASHRAELFARIPSEETDRLHLLTKNLLTEQDVLRHLGEPSKRLEPGSSTTYPGRTGQPSRTETFSILRYDQHSSIAQIDVRVHRDGTVDIRGGFTAHSVASPAIVERGKEDEPIGAEAWP